MVNLLQKVKYTLLSLLIISFILLAGINLIGNRDVRHILQSEKIDWSSDLNPFTGKVIEDQQLATRPLLFSVDNSLQARPQSGIDQADIIYEVPVEGGITRFVVLFYGHLPEKIGPIRSVRPYIVRIAQEYEAMLIHSGASPDGYQLLSELDLLHLDEIYRGSYFWRENGARRPPHNLYTGREELAELVRILPAIKFRPRFTFEKVTAEARGADLSRVEINFWGKKILFNYKEGKFLREINYGKKGQEICCSNLVVQFVSMGLIPGDNAGRLEMELNGSGKAIVFRSGAAVDGTWNKEPGGWSEYYTADGEPVTFTAGTTWILLVPGSAEVSYR